MSELTVKVFMTNDILQFLLEEARKLFPGKNFYFTIHHYDDKNGKRVPGYCISMQKNYDNDRNESSLYVQGCEETIDKASAALLVAFNNEVLKLKSELRVKAEKIIQILGEEEVKCLDVLLSLQEKISTVSPATETNS